MQQVIIISAIFLLFTTPVLAQPDLEFVYPNPNLAPLVVDEGGPNNNNHPVLNRAVDIIKYAFVFALPVGIGFLLIGLILFFIYIKDDKKRKRNIWFIVVDVIIIIIFSFFWLL